MGRRIVRRTPPAMPATLRYFTAEAWLDPDAASVDPVRALQDARTRWRQARARFVAEVVGDGER